MAGQKQFNETQVLDAAMLTFWEKGYEGTSLKQLEDATGLNKSSLYNAYGNKEALYLSCLDRFSQRYGGDLLRLLAAEDFHSAIAAFFEALLKRQRDPGVPPGCMATMAALENGGAIGAGDGLVQNAVEAGLQSMQDAFKARCELAVAQKEISQDTDCDALAAMLLAMSRGVAVMGRGHSDISLAKQAVKGMLERL